MKKKLISREEIEKKLARKSWCDENFRKDLLENPVKVIESLFDTKFPDGTKILIHEETEDTIHFVIPKKKDDNCELDNDVLDKISAGTMWYLNSSSYLAWQQRQH
ncbi:MAG: NHLP leader peptide family RiPP precursor [Desulfobacterales bacterium]|nr:NHLP leader peptide family RiPP precursor [Desulfobacterales bacterium]MBF0395869.1 NHLP leader peptide family RiPP precursor [Desulfobacterales bacterium]